MDCLERCPFCGGMANIKLIEVDEPVTNFDIYYRIGCESCQIFFQHSISSFCASIDEREKVKIALAEKWNHRIG